MPNQLPYQNPAPGTGARPRMEGQSQSPSRPAEQPQKPAEGGSSLGGRVDKVVDDVKTSAIERVGDARKTAESELMSQRDRLAARVNRVGDVLRGASQQLSHEDAFVSRYLEQAGSSVGRAASYVSSADLRSLSGDVQRFARERPAWFIGGAFVAGLALGRFLKSSPRELAQPSFEERWP
jgi:hypothetical protein